MSLVKPYGSLLPYQYVVLRFVPRIDRAEFVNVGVVLHCDEVHYLDAACHVREEAVEALAPGADLAALRAALETVGAVCRGEVGRGQPELPTAGRRFGWLAAARNTSVQPSPVHGGLTTAPGVTLLELLDRYVR
ncbi:MAG: DUF3037 domain-containing protein [Nostocoides sp.]